MAIAFDSKERLLTFHEANKLIQELTGKERSVSMIYHWVEQGVRGVKLDSIKIGSSLFTSFEAIIRFVEATIAAREQAEGNSKTLAQPAPT